MKKLISDHKGLFIVIIHTLFIAEIAASLYYNYDLHSFNLQSALAPWEPYM